MSKTLPLFNSDVELTVLPENCSYHNGNATLNTAFIKKHSGNVYVDGSIEVNAESDLTKIEYLFVNGDVNIIKRLQDDFMKLNTEYNNMNLVKGKYLGNSGSITIDNFMLKSNPDGIMVENFGNVTLKDDISPELISQQLYFRNGGHVSCTEEQIGAVQMISTNVGTIGYSHNNINPLKDIMNSLSNKVINADYYVL